MRFCIALIALVILGGIQTPTPERFGWNPDKKLQWSDFKGTPDYGTPFAATTIAE